jgi:hypothetical protein
VYLNLTFQNEGVKEDFKHSGDTTLCDKVCQWLATGQWFSPGTRVSSTNKTLCNKVCQWLATGQWFSPGTRVSSIEMSNGWIHMIHIMHTICYITIYGWENE